MKCFNSYSNAKVNEYHQGLSTIKGYLPSRVIYHQGLSTIKGYLLLTCQFEVIVTWAKVNHFRKQNYVIWAANSFVIAG